MTTTVSTVALVTMTRRSLSNRLTGLRYRAQDMDPEAMLELHRHLDQFRDEQRARRAAEAEDEQA